MKKDIEWLKSWFDDDKSYTGEYVKFKINHFRGGHEVEEEQLFYVVDKYNTAILSKGIDCNHYPREGVFSDYFVGHEDYMFTEQEIKDYDPRYWAFRKPVEELEECD